MTINDLQEKINADALKLQKKCNNILTVAEDINDSKTLEKYIKLNRDAEKLALNIRKYTILKTSENTQADKNFSKILCGENFKYKVLSNNLIRFDFPPLLNFRLIENKTKKGLNAQGNYFSECAQNKLKNIFFEQSNLLKNEKKIMLIFNVVSSDIPDNFIPDTDNREIRDITNILKSFFLTDDSFQYLSYYLDTIKLHTESKTIVFLSSEEEILSNIKEIKKELENETKIIPFVK